MLFLITRPFCVSHSKLSRSQDVFIMSENKEYQRIQTAGFGQCLPRSFSAQMPPSDVPHEKLKCDVKRRWVCSSTDVKHISKW